MKEIKVRRCKHCGSHYRAGKASSSGFIHSHMPVCGYFGFQISFRFAHGKIFLAAIGNITRKKSF
jgi:hypothetical protein